MNIDAEIEVSSAKDVLAVPIAAVMRGDIVYVAGEKTEPDDRAPEGYKTVKVETGVSDSEFIEIISGLFEGDVVRMEIVAPQNNEMQMMPGMPGGIGGGMPGGMGGGMPGGMGGGMPGGGMPR